MSDGTQLWRKTKDHAGKALGGGSAAAVLVLWFMIQDDLKLARQVPALEKSIQELKESNTKQWELIRSTRDDAMVLKAQTGVLQAQLWRGSQYE